jgi:hypothetical protein
MEAMKALKQFTKIWLRGLLRLLIIFSLASAAPIVLGLAYYANAGQLLTMGLYLVAAVLIPFISGIGD